MSTQRDADSVADMVGAAHRIARYLGGCTEKTFALDEQLQDAVVRRIAVIGDAAMRISAEYKEQHPEVPWRGIVSMRNILVHAYDRVRLEEVWRVATVEIPVLVRQLDALLPPPPDPTES